MNNDQTPLPIPGSNRNAIPNAKLIQPSDPNKKIQVSIYARRNPHPPANLMANVEKLSTELPGKRHYLSDTEFNEIYGASKDDLKAIADWAKENKLSVLEQDPATKRTLVEGTIGDISAAFNVKLDEYEHPKFGHFRGRSGKVYVPEKLYGLVDGVFGLDTRPLGHPRLRRRKGRQIDLKVTGLTGHATPPLPAPGSFYPTQVAELYNYPALDGTGQNVAILAFNGPSNNQQGGYSLAALQNYFKMLGLKSPAITDVVVQGPGNIPGPDTQASENNGDATGEVMLDMCTVGAVAPGAHIFMYFTEFTSKGWVDVLNAAIGGPNKISVISNSYGNPEQDANSAWTKMSVSVVNQAFEAAVAKGITIFSAAGDDGSSDEGQGIPEVDFPASSPYVLGVGGTRVVASSGSSPKITSETVWNDLLQGNGAGGGGISVVFSKPSYQDGVNVPPSVNPPHPIGRGVPDVSALADPDTALAVIHVSGKKMDAVGGTSAAAPLWAGLIARINQGLGTPCGYLNVLLYTKFATGVLRDITSGNNGAYTAAVGWDACTGLGSPQGQKLLQALKGKGGSTASGKAGSKANSKAGGKANAKTGGKASGKAGTKKKKK